MFGGFIFSLTGEGGFIKGLKDRGAGVDRVLLTNRFFLGEPQFRGFDIRGVKMGAKDYVKSITYFEEERLRVLEFGFLEDEVKFALKKESAFLERQAEQPEFIDAWR